MQILITVLSSLILGSQIFLALGYCEDESSKGQTFEIPGQCAIYTCDGAGVSHGIGCPSVAIPPGMNCAKTVDISQPYPACCPQYNC